MTDCNDSASREKAIQLGFSLGTAQEHLYSTSSCKIMGDHKNVVPIELDITSVFVFQLNLSSVQICYIVESFGLVSLIS